MKGTQVLIQEGKPYSEKVILQITDGSSGNVIAPILTVRY